MISVSFLSPRGLDSGVPVPTMSLRRALSLGATIAVALVVLSLVAGSLLGQPILLSYVETGSMEPTLSPGDGFVAIPTELTGPIEEGDVVVFEAEEIQGGGLTTHRVVGETDRGFVTRGDANPFTDQDSDEPPVREEQIVAVAWQPGGTVLALPNLGTVVGGLQGAMQTLQTRLAGLLGTRSLLGTQGIAYLLFGATAVLYVLDVYFEDDKARERDRGRDTGTSARLLVGAMALGLVLAATAAMAAPAGSQEYTIISAEFESDRPFVIERGDSTSITYPVGNSGFVPVVTFLEPGSEAVDVEPRELHVGSNAVVNATLTLSAPPETGAYRRYVAEHRYLAILPTPVIRTLHGVHPWLPVAVIDALIAVPFYLFGIRLLGTGRIRSRSRDAPSRLARLKGRFL
jgi:signal peptidase